MFQEHLSLQLVLICAVAGHEVNGDEVKLDVYRFQSASQGADIVVVEVGLPHAGSEEEDTLVVLLLSTVVIQLSGSEAYCTENVAS